MASCNEKHAGLCGLIKAAEGTEIAIDCHQTQHKQSSQWQTISIFSSKSNIQKSSLETGSELQTLEEL